MTTSREWRSGVSKVAVVMTPHSLSTGHGSWHFNFLLLSTRITELVDPSQLFLAWSEWELQARIAIEASRPAGALLMHSVASTSYLGIRSKLLIPHLPAQEFVQTWEEPNSTSIATPLSHNNYHRSSSSDFVVTGFAHTHRKGFALGGAPLITYLES